MAAGDLITPSDAAALIPEEIAADIIKATSQFSIALTLCRRVAMSTQSLRQPVLSSLPSAYWVQTGGLKQTSDAIWDGLDLIAEEIAVVVVCDDNTLADSAYPIWQEIREPIAQAFAQVLDQAILGSVNKPASWPEGIVPAAKAAGAVVVADATAAQGGIVTDIGEAMSLVEQSGYDVTGIGAKRALKGLLRTAVDSGGQPLLDTTSRVWDTDVTFGVSGVFPADVLALVGQFNLAVVGVRSDLRFQVFTEGVITDTAGNVVNNLMQEDRSALRCCARYGYQLARPATLVDAGGPATPFPFAVLQSAPVIPLAAESKGGTTKK
jgi:HK97 family phage major capsid protein